MEWKQLFKCPRVKEKPQTSLLAEMKHRISINSYCLKSIFPGVCLQNSSSFIIHRKMNTHVCFGSQTILKFASKNKTYEEKNQIFRVANVMKDVPNPSMIYHCWDYSLTRKHFPVFSQSSFARFHKLAATKDLYQRNSNLMRLFSQSTQKMYN